MAKRKSRTWIILLVVVGIVGAMTYSFWPKPLSVDFGIVERSHMVVTIDEDAKTRVKEVYVVSTPVAGRLLRVEVKPGETVAGKDSVVATMLPTNPVVLDVRTREQALAAVKVAEAALQVAQADLNRSIADKELSEQDLARTIQLHVKELVSQADLVRAKRVALMSNASMETAKAAIAMREAEVARVRANLIGFEEPTGDNEENAETIIPLHAPASGRVLRVMQESATTLPVGAPILEIGDISNGLEIVVELLSSDAVRVQAGDRVIVDNWGGEAKLGGVVTRVDPWGFTKFSALGVEEQRVVAVVEFVEPWEQRQTLGHGFRVEVQVVIWEDQDALTVPSSALFREGDNWAVFVENEGAAVKHSVQIGQNNGLQAEVLDGLVEGDTIILYPGANLVDGAQVEQRIVE